MHVGEDCNYDKVSDLISSIKYDFTLVPITLETSDQPEKIFESINATGRMLSEFDYLRNHLFLRARKLDVDKDLDKSYVDIFYDNYWCFEDADLFWNADRLELFLREFLMAQLGLSCFQKDGDKNKKAFDVYQVYSRRLKDKQGKSSKDRHKEKIEYEFKQLNEYATSYGYMTNPDSDIGFRMQFYDDLKITNLRPFILHLRNNLDMSDSDINQVCDILEFYILRRMVCYGHSANDKDEYAYQEIGRFFAELIKGKHEFSVVYLLQSLSRWPTDEAVLGGLRRTSNETFYGKHSARNAAWKLLRYIFYRIERHIAEKPALDFERFSEFGMPTRIIPLPPTDSSLWRSNRDDYLSIGNLTYRQENDLSFNKVNNLLFDETKEILLEHPNSTLELNRDICSHDSWDMEKTRMQKEKLYGYFSEIWLGSDTDSFRRKSLIVHSIKSSPDKLYDGIVESWNEDDSFGYIELTGLGQNVEVKSDDLDPGILSRKLSQFLKVKLNLEIVETEEFLHFQPRNVILVTIGGLYQGEVLMFDPEKGFGFLTTSDYPDNIFMHISQVWGEDINALEKGVPVQFNIVETAERKAPAAINIRLVKSWW